MSTAVDYNLTPQSMVNTIDVQTMIRKTLIDPVVIVNGSAVTLGGGAGVWGSITGTLSAQTDLQDALNLKAALISPVLVTPNLGTPSAGVLTNTTGLPVTTGISGLGTGVATFLATPSSANLAAALTDESGSSTVAFTTSPTFVTPTLGAAIATSITGSTALTLAAGSTAQNVIVQPSTTGVVVLRHGTGSAGTDEVQITPGKSGVINAALYTGAESLFIGAPSGKGVFLNTTSGSGPAAFSASLRLPLGSLLVFNSGSSALLDTIDAGVSRNAAGVVEVNSGSAGTYRDLKLRAVELVDGNVVLGTATGTKVGTATGQKLGFWNATPVVQQILATGGGATADNIITLLQTLGLCKQS